MNPLHSQKTAFSNSISLVSPSWEDSFPREVLALEEKLSEADILHFTHSRLRICLESKIINWDLYKKWHQDHFGSPLLEIASISSSSKKNLIEKCKSTYQQFSKSDAWSQDLIPLEIWDNQLIILGIEYSNKLEQFDNCIFILTQPDFIKETYEYITKDDSNESIDREKEEICLLSGLNLNPLEAVKSSPEIMTTNDDTAWKKISHEHDDITLEARKYFDAYMVLKIQNQCTEVFKIDEDLEREFKNHSIFKYQLENENIFSKILKSKKAETIKLSEIHLQLLDYKFATISPLIMGDKVVGFMIGFKTSLITQEDQSHLTSLAQKVS